METLDTNVEEAYEEAIKYISEQTHDNQEMLENFRKHIRINNQNRVEVDWEYLKGLEVTYVPSMLLVTSLFTLGVLSTKAEGNYAILNKHHFLEVPGIEYSYFTHKDDAETFAEVLSSTKGISPPYYVMKCIKRVGE